MNLYLLAYYLVSNYHADAKIHALAAPASFSSFHLNSLRIDGQNDGPSSTHTKTLFTSPQNRPGVRPRPLHRGTRRLPRKWRRPERHPYHAAHDGTEAQTRGDQTLERGYVHRGRPVVLGLLRRQTSPGER